MQDQMEMRFISDITVSLIDKMGNDARLASAAWVSTSAEEGTKRAQEKPEEVAGVINYLIKHRHGTPFEHSTLQLFVHAPIFVWREWHRHRIGFSYNEESGRYKQLDPVFYIPSRNRPMMKVDGWKPGRPKFTTIEQYITEDEANTIASVLPLSQIIKERTEEHYLTLIQQLRESYELGYKNYEKNLSLNIDPGLARDCLPVGIYSSCWVTCNPRSLMHFLSLRTHDEKAKFVSYPLYEIEEAAYKVEAIFAEAFPITYKAFCDNGRVAP